MANFENMDKTFNIRFEELTFLKGDPGEDGISPVISVSNIPGGHRITIVDVNGMKSFDVMDGEDISAELEAEIKARQNNDTLVLEECTKAIQAVQKQTVEVVVNEQNERARNDKEIRADISDIKGSNEPTPSEGLEFDGYGAVIGIGTCTDTELIIPSEHNGYSIVALGNGNVPSGDYSRIKKIVVPDSVSNIYNFIFSFANNVEIIEIGNGIQRMNMACFSGASLTKIIMHAETPPDVNAGMPPISGTISPECVLCVPENAIDAYKAHDGFWGKFVTEYGGIEPIVEEKAPSLWGLQSQIDEMSASNTFATQALNQKDADLQAQITKEKADREAQDNAVLTAAANAIQANNGNIIQIIVDEQNARASKDKDLQAQIDELKTNGGGGGSGKNYDTEIAELTAKDTELQGQIDTLSNSNKTLINTVNGLSDEINTRVNAETNARQEQFNDLTNTINEIHSLYEEQIADLSARVLALESTPIAEEGAY